MKLICKTYMLTLVVFFLLSTSVFSLDAGYTAFDDGDTNSINNDTIINDADLLSAHGWTLSSGTGTYKAGEGVTGRSLNLPSGNNIAKYLTGDLDSYSGTVTQEWDFRPSSSTNIKYMTNLDAALNSHYGFYGNTNLYAVCNAGDTVSVGSMALFVGGYHSAKVEFYGDNNTIMVYLNDTKVHDCVNNVAITHFGLKSQAGLILDIDNYRMYDGLIDPADTTIIGNSTWNLTSKNLASGNTTAWNSESFVNITNNLASLTVTASESTNMSCAIGQDLNYTSMVALNENFKSATTEATSHAYTVFDNISLGSQCLYCSFINDDGEGENADSHSGCLEIIRSNIFTSIQMNQVNVSNILISLPSFTTIVQRTLNTSKSEDIIVLNSLNLEKINAGGTNDIRLRLFADGVSLKEEVVRSVSSVGNIGVAGLSATKFRLPVGEHNITLQIARSGAGTINVSNVDLLVIIASDSNNDNVIKANITDIFASHSTDVFEEAFNFTMQKFVESKNFILWRLTAFKSTPGISEISYLMRDYGNELSPLAERTLSSASDIGSLGMMHIDDVESISHEHTILAKQTDTGDTVTINGSIFDIDLRDSEHQLMKNFYSTSEATNGTFTNNLTTGTHVLTTGSILSEDGDSMFISSSASFQSLSGAQTPTFFIIWENQRVEKKRTLSDNTEIGNIFMFDKLLNITTKKNVSVSLQVSVETGETLSIRDESIVGIESNSFNIESTGLPPISSAIMTPVNNSAVIGITPITWGIFTDPDNDLDNCTITLYDNNFNFNESIENTTAIDTSSSFNFSSVNADFYNIVVQCFDVSGLDANTSVNIQNVFLDPIDVNNTLPLNNSIINTTLDIDFSFVVNFDTNCTLNLNSSANQTLVASAGSNTFATVTLLNESYEWNVNCLNASLSATSENYFLTMRRLISTEPPDDATSSLELPFDSVTNAFIFFALVILYLGVMMIAFSFKNFGFGSLGFFLGIILGLLLGNIHIFLTFAFLFINVVIYAKTITGFK